MRHFWIFCHLAGFTMWLGGGFGVMFASLATRSAPRDQLATVARTLGAIYLKLLGPGAALVVISGVVLTMQLMAGFSGPVPPSLMVMQGAGLLGAALTLVVQVPAASRMMRADPVAQAAAFDGLRLRLRRIGPIVGLLGLIALIAGAMIR